MAKSIEDSIKMTLLLEFEMMFPNEQPLEPEVYLKGGSRSVILNIAALFLGFKNFNSEYKDQKKLLSFMFSKENADFANDIYDKIQALQKEGKEVNIINTYSSLSLFEYFFQKEEEKEIQTHAEFERNLFKAYLILNSRFTLRQQKAFTSTEHIDSDLHIPMMLFCMSYPYSDKKNYNINEVWTSQAIKAIYLFNFLEAETKMQPLLTAFLSYFECKTWQEYMKSILPLTLPAIQNQKEGHTDIEINKDEDFEKNCSFLEKFIIQDDNPLDENDFKSLRSKPVYKVDEGIYRIIFNLFIVEKIYKGLYFTLNILNDQLPKKDKISEFKSYYGYEISEKIISYEIIRSIYPVDKCISFSGQELSDLKIDAAPDYYIRKGKNILIFESKDFLIPAESKESFDYEVYQDEFEKKLYFEEKDGKQVYKAVMQLIENVRNLLKSNFEPDKGYNYREVCIYPILLTHDYQYDVVGFNTLINYWFQAELEVLEEEGIFIHRVKPLIVINIDSLIYHQVALQKESLHCFLDKYEKHLKKKPSHKLKNMEEVTNFITSKQMPFSIFIEKELLNKTLDDMPEQLKSLTPILFDGN
jgi:hypothetical protein